MSQESAQEKIYEEIKRRKLEDYEHVQLTSNLREGITSIIFMYQNCSASERTINKNLLSELEKFTIDFSRENTIGFPIIKQREETQIWKNAQENITRAKIHFMYEPIDTTLKFLNKEIGYIWSIYLPARRNDGDVGYCTISYPPSNRDKIRYFLALVNQYSNELHASSKYINMYRGSNIYLDGEHTWNSLILTKEMKQAIKDDLEFWIASEDLYRKRNIPYRRGYLFEGPPGNGKTAVTRTILSTYDFTAFGFDFSDPRHIDANLQEAFNIAANAAPAVFILEDIDRIFSSNRCSRITKEGLFNCLDGVATYSGVVIIATANNPKVLDKAIRHRPGRFDVPVHFPNPAYAQRLEFLKYLLGNDQEHEVDADTITLATSECKGMSMAFIKLVYEIAATKAFKRKTDIISNLDLLDGVKQAKKYYNSMEFLEDRSAGFDLKNQSVDEDDLKELRDPSDEKIEMIEKTENPQAAPNSFTFYPSHFRP